MRSSVVLLTALVCLVSTLELANTSAQDARSSTRYPLFDQTAQYPLYERPSQLSAREFLAARQEAQESSQDAPTTGQGAQPGPNGESDPAADQAPRPDEADQRDQDEQQQPQEVDFRPGLTSSVLDPVVDLQRTRQLREQAKTPGDALFRKSPLTPLRERFIQAEKRIYEKTNIKFGANINTLFQGLTDNIPGTDDYGMGSFVQFNSTWDGFRKECPNKGEITLGVEGRWNWGTTDPVTLGAVGLGSSGFTANPFTTYTPTFLVRNLFWRQGSREAGWMYRVGRVTPDQFLSTSQHVTPLTINMPIISTGAFAMGLPDSGIGMFGGLFINDRINIAGVVSDANADRTKFGQIQEGDLFSAVELQAKIFPFTKNAGYSKLTFWHHDGTKFGTPLNGSTGAEGWGFFIKAEQELSRDGRIIGLMRYGKSYRDSALYEQLAAGHLIVYDPFKSGRYKRRGYNADLAGLVYGWIQPTGADRDESNIEAFYRFALFPEMQATISYQAIINPALDPTNDYGSAISFRLRSTW